MPGSKTRAHALPSDEKATSPLARIAGTPSADAASGLASGVPKSLTKDLEIEVAADGSGMIGPGVELKGEEDSPEAALAAFAAAEWELWPRENCFVPTNEQWGEIAPEILPEMRLAWVTMTKTKPEMLEVVASFEGNDEPIEALLNGWSRSADFLTGLADMMTAARSRLALARGADIANAPLEG